MRFRVVIKKGYPPTYTTLYRDLLLTEAIQLYWIAKKSRVGNFRELCILLDRDTR